MSFNIILQKNTSDPRKINKTLEEISMVTGTLKSECSIFDPIIEIVDSNADCLKANYLTIEAFGRSYFIENITATKALNVFRIEAHVDVLQSFAESILASECVIERSTSSNSQFLDDTLVPLDSRTEVEIKSFTSPFTTQEFILLVNG